jgi:hypothetical protein
MEPAAPAERLALEVAGTVLGGVTNDLFTGGISLGLRMPVGQRFDLRLRTALLRPARGEVDGLRYERDLLPVDAMVTTAIPRTPNLRAGAGVAAVRVTDDDPRAGSVWAFGATGRAEYRLPVRGFAVTAALQGSLLPRAWRLIAARDGQFALPPWTLGASLGLEFPLF